MPKIITNKERIDRLTKELAKLKAEKDAEISELKKERRALKAKISYLDGKLPTNENLDSKYIETIKSLDIQNLTAENCRMYQRIRELENQLYTARKEIAEIQEYNEKSDFSDDVSFANITRLACFYLDAPNLVDDEKPFFDYRTLAININPLNGSIVTSSQYSKIMNILQNKCIGYKEALENFSSFKDVSELSTRDLWLLNKLGRGFLKYYMIVFTNYDLIDSKWFSL